MSDITYVFSAHEFFPLFSFMISLLVFATIWRVFFPKLTQPTWPNWVKQTILHAYSEYQHNMPLVYLINIPTYTIITITSHTHTHTHTNGYLKQTFFLSDCLFCCVLSGKNREKEEKSGRSFHFASPGR